MYDVIVIGGGAAGFFSAISAAERNLKVALLEKSLKVLSKVRISGGGRCNVTHGCFDPAVLITNYPRGSKELLGPFHQFQPKNTMNWFEERGVALKIEEDGRVFPKSDSSETIIDCLTQAAQKAGVDLQVGVSILNVENGFKIITKQGELEAKSLILATGSSPQGHAWAAQLGHTITPLVPSLFTFNVPTSPLLELSGISAQATVSIEGTSLKATGPLLLTHFGFSGPAVLRLSAWGAEKLHEMNYQATLIIDWTAGMKKEQLIEQIKKLKTEKPSQIFSLDLVLDLPKNLSKTLYSPTKRLAELSSKDIEQIALLLTQNRYAIEGKTTYKSEFVTCGGVKRSEVNFKTMESKICKGLYFAGEILDIDGITGGFNFQNAWTTGWIAGKGLG